MVIIMVINIKIKIIIMVIIMKMILISAYLWPFSASMQSIFVAPFKLIKPSAKTSHSRTMLL